MSQEKLPTPIEPLLVCLPCGIVALKKAGLETPQKPINFWFDAVCEICWSYTQVTEAKLFGDLWKN